MSRVPFNDVFKGQQKKLVRATFKKAIINQVYANSSTADVYFSGNPQTIIKGVPLATHIIPSLVSVGDKCRVDVFDETNPNDMVVAYIYGKKTPYQQAVLFNQGQTGVTTSSSFTIAHGLGVTPNIFGVWVESVQNNNDAGVPFVDVSKGVKGADATYIYLTAAGLTGYTFSCNWFVLKI
jgi:hypothetical protein